MIHHIGHWEDNELVNRWDCWCLCYDESGDIIESKRMAILRLKYFKTPTIIYMHDYEGLTKEQLIAELNVTNEKLKQVNNKLQYSPLSNGAGSPPSGQGKDPLTPPETKDTAPNIITITIPFKNKGSKATLTFPEDYEDGDMDKIARIVQAYRQDKE